ncbi:hypothetical protein P20495_0644 [Pseudoalteromonas sp. BSi20495]|nr:hypothetical protein P20495_0644 [Pseudoalteromonas sp. BSi20495]
MARYKQTTKHQIKQVIKIKNNKKPLFLTRIGKKKHLIQSL